MKIEEVDAVVAEAYQNLQKIEVNESNLELEMLKERFNLIVEIADGFKQKEIELAKRADENQEKFEDKISAQKVLIGILPYMVGGKIFQAALTRVGYEAVGVVGGYLIRWVPEVMLLIDGVEEMPKSFEEYCVKMKISLGDLEKLGIEKGVLDGFRKKYDGGTVEEKKKVAKEIFELVCK